MNRVRHGLLHPIKRNVAYWSMDFMQDTLICGHAQYTVTVIDDFATDVLAIEINFRVSGSSR
jgi:hypothetical protein